MILLNPGSTALTRWRIVLMCVLTAPCVPAYGITFDQVAEGDGTPVAAGNLVEIRCAVIGRTRRWPRQTGCFFSSGFRSRPAGRSESRPPARLPALPASL